MQAPTAVITPLREVRDSAALWATLATASDTAQFCQSWLALQCRTLDARAGLVLWRQPDDSFAPVAVWPNAAHDVTYLGPVARQALGEQRGLFVRATGHDATAAAPGAGRVYLAYPVGTDDVLTAVAVVDLVASSEEHLQLSMRSLHWGAGWLQSRAGAGMVATLSTSLARMRQANDTVVAIGEQVDAQGALIAFVNTLARELDARRVLVGIATDGRIKLRAISNTASFDGKTQAVAAVENLMEEALDQGAAIGAPALAGDAFQVNVAHEEHRRDSALASVQSVLLSGRDGPVGVVTVEHATDATLSPEQAGFTEAVALLAGPVIEDKLALEHWFAGRGAELARTGWERLTQRGHGTFKLAAAALLLAFAVLGLVEQQFRVTARAVVEGAVQRAAVAPFRGYVATAPVRAGQTVKQGQVLAVLDDRDLVLERARWVAEREQAAQKYRDALAKRERAEAVILAAQMRQAQAELDLVEEKLSRARITAPIAGLVVSGDLSQTLGTPIEAGDKLFEIAPLDAYRVVIQVDERDIAHVAVGQTGRMVLTGRPGKPLGFKVGNVTAISEQHDGRNVFRVEAQVDSTAVGLRPGMEGVGKIDAGERSILWVWTHRFTDWLRLTLWRWLP